MTFGVKFSASEVDDAFAEMKIDEVTTQQPSYHIMFSQLLKLFPISGHDRRCPPEGPDGVQVKCQAQLKLGGNSLIITNNFGPGFKTEKPPQQILISQIHIKQAVTFRMAGSKRRQCDKC